MAATHTRPTARMTRVMFASHRLCREPIFLISSFIRIMRPTYNQGPTPW